MKSDVVFLDVGGVRFKTTTSTLLSQQSPYFESLLDERWADRKHEIFIDRDGEAFRSVLSFMRMADDGRMALIASLTPRERAVLGDEAQYFQLSSLTNLINSMTMPVNTPAMQLKSFCVPGSGYPWLVNKDIVKIERDWSVVQAALHTYGDRSRWEVLMRKNSV